MRANRRLPNTGRGPAAAGGGAWVCVLASLMVACASTAPVPKDKLAVAEQAVKRAEDAGAAEYASSELGLAREKLSQAKGKADDEEKGRSEKDAKEIGRLADQAAVDARLAEARAEAGKADQAVAELEDSVRAIREEAGRAQPPAPPPQQSLPPPQSTPPQQ